MLLIGIIIGLPIGCLLGIFLTSLAVAAHKGDMQGQAIPEDKIEPAEDLMKGREDK